MIQTVVFDTKPYDREQLQRAGVGSDIEWRFMEFRLSAETAVAAQGAQAICTFVNDHVDRPCLKELAKLGVKHIALRCAGFNSVDLPAAKELGFSRHARSRLTPLTPSPSMRSLCSSPSTAKSRARTIASTI